MINENDIRRVADLAMLEIESEKMPEYISEMEKLLSFARKIDTVALDGDDESFFTVCGKTPLREDKCEKSAQRSDILSNAAETEDGFIKLRKKA